MSTIVAQSTPSTASAIAIIRLSGEQALPLVKAVFSGFNGEVKPRYMYYGRLDTGKIRDDCMCVYFRAPHSYTGEDMVEINCHGSVAVCRGIIEYFLSAGAVMAQRGEYTRRAFENGKMDLTESEAVIDLINAQSEAEARSAFEQLGGALSAKIGALQKEVTSLIAQTEAAIDYPEEDVEEMTAGAIRGSVVSLIDKLNALKNTYDSGKIMRSGVKVAIVGQPNAGKSMLLNRLLGYERSIVSDVAGTTRDYVEESFLLGDIRFVLVDTAGVRDASDAVEQMGVKRSIDVMNGADIVLSVAAPDGEFLCRDDKRALFVENKSDLQKGTRSFAVNISALTGEGLENLKSVLYEKALSLSASGLGTINNLRHLQAVTNALSAATRALAAIDDCLPPDLIGDDLMGVYRALGSITGITSSDEIVGEIFSRFCVGK